MSLHFPCNIFDIWDYVDAGKPTIFDVPNGKEHMTRSSTGFIALKVEAIMASEKINVDLVSLGDTKASHQEHINTTQETGALEEWDQLINILTLNEIYIDEPKLRERVGPLK